MNKVLTILYYLENIKATYLKDFKQSSSRMRPRRSDSGMYTLRRGMLWSSSSKFSGN